MKQKFLPAFIGLNTDLPARRIPEHRLSDVSNVVFKDATVQKRWGFDRMNIANVLDSAVMKIHMYETAISNTLELLVFTTEEAYLYNTGNGRFKTITRVYTEGSAAASGSSITGTDTYWMPSWDSDYGNLKIGFGDTDPDNITTWYTVSAVAASEITIEEDAGTVADGDYCLKFCFSGDEDDFFSCANPYDGKTGDRIVAVCNGIEEILIYTGSSECLKPISQQAASYTSGSADVLIDEGDAVFIGQSVYGPAVPENTVITAISGDEITMSNNATATVENYIWFGDRRPARFLGYFGSVGFEHFISAWIADTINEPQRIEVSAAGKYPEKFLNDVTGDYGTYYILLDNPSEIKGIHGLQNKIMIYKEKSISEMWSVPNGNNSDPYNFIQDKIRDAGPLSGETVVNFGRFHLFMGWDNFYMFDGINLKPIGDEVMREIIDNLNETYANRCFAFPIREEKLYVVFLPIGENQELPNTCYAYNYIESSWTKWDFTDENGDEINFMSWGRYRRSYEPTWADLATAGTLWSEMGMRWVDLIIFENIDRYILGDSNGYIYEFAPEYGTDNGYGFVSSFTTKDFDMGNPKYTVKVLEAILGMRAQTSGSIRIRGSADFGNNWSEWRTVAISGVDEYIESVANFNIRGKQVRFQIDNNVDSPPSYFEIENLNIGYNDSGLKR